MTVTVDGRRLDPGPFAPPWRRSAFGQIIDRATDDRTTPARVEVREADGTTFTDIIAARRRRSRPEPEPEVPAGPVFHAVDGEGFVPGEDVAVAVVTGHTDAATPAPRAPSSARPGSASTGPAGSSRSSCSAVSPAPRSSGGCRERAGPADRLVRGRADQRRDDRAGRPVRRHADLARRWIDGRVPDRHAPAGR
ncbi:hypothetical protein [Nakamurella leprariae]|uniref:Uncharacterized protein n=1 Tax=Nakamurella leprariae TaxID=2803911 RepID=A0A938YKU5_9ACTN|nr:hypothetical protein [Nakamurella leprariae]MBM9469625.1 hypothetical protein [Nakamurella leprariae]